MSRAALVLAIVLAPATAAAFSDPVLFGDPVAEGGTAGRYFTGSRADKYACSACHDGGPAPRFEIDPLPDQLQAGMRYTLAIHWSDPGSPQALTVELATPSGTPPMVSIAAPTALPPLSRCNGMANGQPAVYSVDVGVRRIVGVEDCGASRVEVSFVATGEPIEVAISGVRSNEDSLPSGDGVFEKRFTLSARPAAAACAAGGTPASLLAPTAALLVLARRRRRRRA